MAAIKESCLMTFVVNTAIRGTFLWFLISLFSSDIAVLINCKSFWPRTDLNFLIMIYSVMHVKLFPSVRYVAMSTDVMLITDLPTVTHPACLSRIFSTLKQ